MQLGKPALAVWLSVIGVAAAWVIWKGFTTHPPIGTSLSTPPVGASLLGRPLKVGIASRPGYVGGIVACKGFKCDETSIYRTKYHLPVEFVLLEDADSRAKAFARGDVDIVWTTVDLSASELPAFVAARTPAKIIIQVDWSRGGDAIVADKSIRRPEDLEGRRIALVPMGPSRWLLENVLGQSELRDDEVAALMKTVDIKGSSSEASEAFALGNSDAAVVWWPDVKEALAKRPGAHVLASSKTRDHIIADCLIAHQEFIAKHPAVIMAFVNGWLDGTTKANADHPMVARLLMENECQYKNLGEDQILTGLDTVKWADLGDNVEMFGLDGRQPVFAKLFRDAGQLWFKRGNIKKLVAPAEAVDLTFVREAYQAQR